MVEEGSMDKGICCENLKTWNSHKGGSRELIILSLSLSLPFPSLSVQKQSTEHACWNSLLQSVAEMTALQVERTSFSFPLHLENCHFFLHGEWRVWPFHGITESLRLGSNEKERWAPWRRWWCRVFEFKPLFIQDTEYYLSCQNWKMKDSFITDFSFHCLLSSEGTKLFWSESLNLDYPQDGSIGQDRKFSHLTCYWHFQNGLYVYFQNLL